MGAGREASISLDGVRDKNVMQLKKLNTALFPVRYNDKYYADALASGDFTKLGLLLSLSLPALSLPTFSGFSLFRAPNLLSGRSEGFSWIDCVLGSGFLFGLLLVWILMGLFPWRAGKCWAARGKTRQVGVPVTNSSLRATLGCFSSVLFWNIICDGVMFKWVGGGFSFGLWNCSFPSTSYVPVDCVRRERMCKRIFHGRYSTFQWPCLWDIRISCFIVVLLYVP